MAEIDEHFIYVMGYNKGFKDGIKGSILKVDAVAMLEDLKKEIEEIVKEEEPNDKKWANGLHYSEKIIQQKIDALKEQTDGKA